MERYSRGTVSRLWLKTSGPESMAIWAAATAALADIGTGRLLAHRDQPMIADNAPGLVVAHGAGRAHAQPGWFAQHGAVRPRLLLRVAQCSVNDRDHGP